MKTPFSKSLLIWLVILLLSLLLVANSDNPVNQNKNTARNEPLYDEYYPEDIDILEEFIQSYYLLLDSEEYLQKYKFINKSVNYIQNDHTALAPFYQKLAELRNGLRKRVTIFQIGDSHIQSGYFAGTARSSLQKYYGNAGRGLVFPFKLAGTNQPDDIRITSNTTWHRTELEKGICGYGLSTTNSGNLHIKTNNFFGLDNSYDMITLITKEKEKSFDWSVANTNTDDEINSFGEQTVYQFKWQKAVSEVDLQFSPELSDDLSYLYGIILEKDNPGLLYHSMGMNGASFERIANIDEFFPQIRLLNADLIVVSLGTNDAQGKYRSEQFVKQLKRFMNLLTKFNPEIPVIFTLPPDSNKNGKHNADLEKVNDEIISFAKKYDYAWWNLSEVMGGRNSIINWRNNLLATRDLLHFTPKGYMLQGNLFYQALIKGYKDYAEHRN